MGYIKKTQTVTADVEAIVGARCDSCGMELTETTGNSGCFVGALNMTLDGGYDEFFDDVPVKVIICGKCARGLLDKNPWLERAIEEQATW